MRHCSSSLPLFYYKDGTCWKSGESETLEKHTHCSKNMWDPKTLDESSRSMRVDVVTEIPEPECELEWMMSMWLTELLHSSPEVAVLDSEWEGCLFHCRQGCMVRNISGTFQASMERILKEKAHSSTIHPIPDSYSWTTKPFQHKLLVHKRAEYYHTQTTWGGKLYFLY